MSFFPFMGLLYSSTHQLYSDVDDVLFIFGTYCAKVFSLMLFVLSSSPFMQAYEAALYLPLTLSLRSSPSFFFPMRLSHYWPSPRLPPHYVFLVSLSTQMGTHTHTNLVFSLSSHSRGDTLINRHGSNQLIVWCHSVLDGTCFCTHIHNTPLHNSKGDYMWWNSISSTFCC